MAGGGRKKRPPGLEKVVRKKIKAGTVALYCGENEIDRYAIGETVQLHKVASSTRRGLGNLIVSDLHEEGY